MALALRAGVTRSDDAAIGRLTSDAPGEGAVGVMRGLRTGEVNRDRHCALRGGLIATQDPLADELFPGDAASAAGKGPRLFG